MRIQFEIAEQRHGSYRHLAALRWVMVFIFVWFAIQKFSADAAESIQPLIANSPFMSWLGVFGVRGEARILGSIELTTATLLALMRFPLGVRARERDGHGHVSADDLLRLHDARYH